MSFLARFDGDKCPKCGTAIVEGERVEYNEGQILQHATGHCEVSEAKAEEERKVWDTRLGETEERLALEGLELARVAPLGPQGKCPVHHIELPRTKICDFC